MPARQSYLSAWKLSFALIAALAAALLMSAGLHAQSTPAGTTNVVGNNAQPSQQAQQLPDAPQQRTNPPKYDPAYEKLARGTGGQVIYLDRSEASKTSQIIEATQNRETILTVHDRKAPGSITFPVDSFTHTLYIRLYASEAGPEMKVFRPSGRPVEEGPVTVRVTQLARGQIMAIDVPERGMWRVDYVPRGTASLAVTAQTDLFLTAFRFVELKGRIGHEGLMPIAGNPAAGHHMTAELICSDETLANAEVSLVADDLAEFSQTKFRALSSGQFLGTVRVPEQPFRVLVRGTDVNGQQYQRMYSPMFTPEKE